MAFFRRRGLGFPRNTERGRQTFFDVDEARELVMDSDSDLDEELQTAMDDAMSMSESSTTEDEADDTHRVGPSAVQSETPRATEPPAKKRRRLFETARNEAVHETPQPLGDDFRPPSDIDGDDGDDGDDADDEAEAEQHEAEDDNGVDINGGDENADIDDGDLEERINWEQVQAHGPGPTVFEFRGSPGVNPDCGLNAEDTRPVDCYKAFISDEIFADMAEETNRYAKQCRDGDAPEWKTTVGELKIFWALCLLMGVLGKPAIYLYWSTRFILHTPIFGKSISRDRFKDILRYLHFCNNDARPPRDDNNRDPLFKVRKFYSKVTAAFQRVFTPGEFVSVDEGMIRFFGRLSFKTYNPQKPAKYGMKAYKVCDQSGYTWKFQLYTGKSNYRWRNYTGLVALVMSMLTGLLHQGRKVFMDNFYTSPTLFLALFRCSTNACGTVRANRRNMPNELNKNSTKLRVGESLFMKGKDLLGMIWRDKRVFAMLSTMHDQQFVDTGKQNRRTGENIRKPKMVTDYNKHMGSVDVSDFLTAKYADLRRSLKWYKKLVFHLSDLAMTNAYIVYRSVTGKPCTHIDFVLDVIEQLLAEGQMEATDRPKPASRGKKSSPVLRRDNPTRLEYSSSDHWPTEIPATEKKQKPTRLCEVCKPSRSETRYFCPPCDIALHAKCFRPYHTLLHYSNGHEE